jgi:hypothetical protein
LGECENDGFASEVRRAEPSTTLAALVAVLGLTTCAPSPPDPAHPGSYVPLCVNALRFAQSKTHALDLAGLTASDPTVLRRGARIQCPITDGSNSGQVTLDLVCKDYRRSACISVVAADLNGLTVYSGGAVTAALPSGANTKQ